MSMIEEIDEPGVLVCSRAPMPTQKRYAWHPATGLHEWDKDCTFAAPPDVPCCKAVYMDPEVFESLRRVEAERDAARLISTSIPIEVLREHWLTGVECDHEAKTDVSTCYCGRWRSTPQPNIPGAVDEWIKHLQEQCQ